MNRLLSDSVENIELFRREYLEECLTVKELSDRHNCSTAVVQRFLKKHNIRKVELFRPTLAQHSLIVNLLNEGVLRKDIAAQLGVPAYAINRYVNSSILYKGKYSNTLSDESWIQNKTDVFWYFLGLFSADGHLGRFNEVALFQKNGHYLKQLQTVIGHSGKLYGKDKTCYTIHITSRQLHLALEEYGFEADKRYNAPYIHTPSLTSQLLYLRGMFDGDGSLYYDYVSGVFRGLNFQITTGSPLIAEGVYDFLLNTLKIKAYKEQELSKVGNTCYHVGCRNKEGVLSIFSCLYQDSPSICLFRKYKNFLKCKELMDLNNRVDDIVEPPMKIGE